MNLQDLYKEFLVNAEGDSARPQGTPLFTRIFAMVLGWFLLLRLPTITQKQRDDAERSALSSVRLLLVAYSELLATHADIAAGLKLTPENMEDLLRRDLELPKLIGNARGLLATVQSENRRLDEEIAHYNARLEKACAAAEQDGSLPGDERQQIGADSGELERLAEQKQKQREADKKSQERSGSGTQKKLRQAAAQKNLSQIAAELMQAARKRLGPGGGESSH